MAAQPKQHPRTTLLLILLLTTAFVSTLPGPAFAEDNGQYIWVLESTAVNPEGHQTAFFGGGQDPDWFPESRFEGKSLVYSISDTGFTVHDRDVDRDYVYHDASISLTFDPPPQELKSGETVTVEATASHSGFVNEGGAGITARFWYTSEDIKITPEDVFTYAPWNQNADNNNTASFQFTTPDPGSRDTFSITASLWNCAPCQVTWTYRSQEVEGVQGIQDPGVDPAREAECAAMREELADMAEPSRNRYAADIQLGIIGFAVAKTGDARVNYCEGGDGHLNRYDPIRIGDCVETGSDGLVRVQINDRDDALDAGPSVLNIATNSKLCFTDFEIYGDRRTMTYDLIYGTVRKFLSGWGRGSSANIETGVTVCGMRGTDVIVQYNPSGEEVYAFVREGIMDITSLETGEVQTLTEGQSLTVQQGFLGDVNSLDEDTWDSIVEDLDLDLSEQETFPDEEENVLPGLEEEFEEALPGLFEEIEIDISGDSDAGWFSPRLLIPVLCLLCGGGLAVIGILVVILLTRRKKKDKSGGGPVES